MIETNLKQGYLDYPYLFDYLFIQQSLYFDGCSLILFRRYGRVEILSGYVNGIFLVVISFFVFLAALQRLFDPPKVNTERLLVRNAPQLKSIMIYVLAA